MSLHAFFLRSFIVLCAAATVSAYNSPTLYPNPALNGIGIEKTMAKITSGQPVKIIYYGQSIVDSRVGVWWPDTVTKYLKSRYPSANITAKNLATSGCDVTCMTNNDNITIQLVPENPDLVVLYIYFHLENEMEVMIKQMVSKLPNTEIVVFDFHYSLPLSKWTPTSSRSEVPWEDALSYDYLPWLCEKYKMGYLDIRTPWIKYLADYNNKVDNGLLTNASDGIHLTQQGNWIMAEFVKPYFVVKPTDNVLPLVDSISALGNKIRIKFSEKVDSLSAVTAANFTVDNGVLSVNTVTLNPDKRTVVALIASSLSDGAHTVAVKNIKDRAGNIMAASQKTVTVAMPATWSSVDIGRVFTPGSMTMNQTTGEFIVRAGGEHASPMNCAWGSMTNPCDPYWMWRNEFQYVNKTVTGNFVLTARINFVDSLSPLSQAGIMVREDLQYLSKFVAINTFKRNGGFFDYVKRTNLLDTIVTVKPRTAKSPTTWLRLSRAGATLEAFTSSNGTAWVSEGITSVPMTDQVTAGLFLCGNEYSLGPFMAKFNNVSIVQEPTKIKPRLMPAGQGARGITLTEKGVTLNGFRENGVREIVILDFRGRQIFKDRAAQAFYSAAILGLSPGVYIVSVKESDPASGRVNTWAGKYAVQ